MGPLELLFGIVFYLVILAIPVFIAYAIVRLAVRTELRKRDREGRGRY